MEKDTKRSEVKGGKGKSKQQRRARLVEKELWCFQVAVCVCARVCVFMCGQAANKAWHPRNLIYWTDVKSRAAKKRIKAFA